MKVAVVGAGITGLTVAHELLKKGHQAVLFDRSHPGGLIAGFACPGAEETFLDRFYHHVFTDDTAVLSLIGELGLADDLVWAESSSAVYAKGRAWPLSGAMDLVRFRPLGSVAHRLLMGMIYLELKRRRDWSRLDGVSCREFFRRRAFWMTSLGPWASESTSAVTVAPSRTGWPTFRVSSSWQASTRSKTTCSPAGRSR